MKIEMDPGGQSMMNIQDDILRSLGNPSPHIMEKDDITGAVILDTAPSGDVQRYLYDRSDTPLRIRTKWGLQLAEGIDCLLQARGLGP
jgi:hypothetical protein